MSEPEIARRCLSCGASVRRQAAFCPQCGQLLAKQQPDSHTDSQTEPLEGQVEPVSAVVESTSEAQSITPEASEASSVTQTDIIIPEDVQTYPAPMVAETQPLITQTIQRDPTVVSDADGPVQHADGVAPLGAEHPLMDRVDRLRKVSSVVIDQAAYDPSLRFLLVAALLFILFVILMILSKVIG